MLLVSIAKGRADLVDYIKKPEPKYSWKLKAKTVGQQVRLMNLNPSQEWHDIVWKHQLQVYQPKDVSPNATMLIYNTGRWNILNRAPSVSSWPA